jgi:hypothetical protein
VPICSVPIQLRSNDLVIDAHSVQVKLDGVIVAMPSIDLLRFKKNSKGAISGTEMVLRFMPTVHMRSIDGSEFEVKLISYCRLSLNKFHVYLAFQSLDKRELGKLKGFVAEFA